MEEDGGMSEEGIGRKREEKRKNRRDELPRP